MIFIKENIYKKIINLKKESCGFIFGKNCVDNFYLMKNKSSKKDEFKIGSFNFLLFVFKNFFKLLKCNHFIVFHVHSLSKDLSQKDKKNMISGILYAIVFKNNINLYIKNKKIYYLGTVKVKCKKWKI